MSRFFRQVIGELAALSARGFPGQILTYLADLLASYGHPSRPNTPRPAREVLTADRLRKLLSYNPATGIFRWRVSRSGVKAGKVAGRARGRKGYCQICVDRKFYQAGRLAWLYMTDKWPKLEINHINGNRSDTRWDNLREVTRSQKAASTPTHNKLGARGVWITRTGKYAARITLDGKRTHLGLFETLEDASAAYAKAAKGVFGIFASER